MKLNKTIAVLMLYLIVWAAMYELHNAWATLLSFHAWMLIAIWLARPGIPARKLFECEDHLTLLIGCVVLSICSGGLLYLSWQSLIEIPDLPAHLASLGLTAKTMPAFIAYFSLVNPWIEEYFWRGYLGSPNRSLVLTDVLFAGYHLVVLYGVVSAGWMAATVVVLTLVAWLWRQASRVSKGLLIAALAHFAADLTILLVVYAMLMKG